MCTATLMALAALAVTGGAEAGYAFARPSSSVYYGGVGGVGGGAYASSRAYAAAGDTLTVLADEPYAVDSSLSAVPLLIVPSNQLRVLHDARIASVSPTRPVVTLQAPEREATPAVRVVLARPMVVSSPQSTIPFPSGFTVVHQGLRMPIPVGAVLAPVPHGAYVSAQRPYAVRIVYAVPTGPLPFAYPFHSQFQFSHPLFFNPGPVSGTALATIPSRPGFGAQRPGLAPSVPRPGFGAQRPGLSPQRPPVGPSTPVPLLPAAPPSTPTPELPSRPQQQIPPRPPIVSSGRPVVTVLDFPTAVASPPVLVVQRPVFGEEDELSSPPQAVVPAGIVQSTQPRPIESVFSNSKDNDFLQQMRDQAALNAAGTGGGADSNLADYDNIVEVLYN